MATDKPNDPAAEAKTWIVTMSPERPFGEIAQALAAAGFVIEQRLDQIGVITGRIDDKGAARLSSIPGVADVSPDASVDIGPPGSYTAD